jgi:hypothetical protein
MYCLQFVGAGLLAALLGSPAADAAATRKAEDPITALRTAYERRSKFPGWVQGIKARVSVEENGHNWTADVEFRFSGKPVITGLEAPEPLRKWVETQIASACTHRLAVPFSEGPGKYPLTAEASSDDARSVRVKLADPFQSVYTVREGQIIEVDRRMGSVRLTLNMQENLNLPDGSCLPKHFTATYRDSGSQAIQRVEVFTDTFAELDGVWVPSVRRTVTLSQQGMLDRTLRLTAMRLIGSRTVTNR